MTVSAVLGNNIYNKESVSLAKSGKGIADYYEASWTIVDGYIFRVGGKVVEKGFLKFMGA
ncbi:MAG: hypothetical protein GWN56_11865 [Nitrosopumilaceae archaeon]|nr:hypothetical protein [Nitrosopumilaceae archaeon]